MGLIIDSDVVERLLVRQDEEYAPVLQAIRTRKQKIVHGGKLTRELVRNLDVRRLLTVLDDAGMVRVVADAEISPVAQRLVQDDICRSNDQHIIALAQISHARLLCSLDELLIEDFKDKALINSPRGKVYKEASHRALVAKACDRRCCCLA